MVRQQLPLSHFSDRVHLPLLRTAAIQTGDTVDLFQGCSRDAGGEIVAIVRMVKPFENFAAISDPCW